MPKKIGREKAKAKGLKRYYTGEPCIWGHLAQKYVSSQGCVECGQERTEANREKKNAYDKIYRNRKGKRKKARDISSAYYAANREKARAASRAYYAANWELIGAKAKAKRKKK